MESEENNEEEVEESKGEVEEANESEEEETPEAEEEDDREEWTSTATSARTVAMSCAARTAPRWLTTAALASRGPPWAIGGARIALSRRQPWRRRKPRVPA